MSRNDTKFDRKSDKKKVKDNLVGSWGVKEKCHGCGLVKESRRMFIKEDQIYCARCF